MYLSNRGSDIDRMETRVCLRKLLSKFLRSSSQLYEIQVRGWPGEVLHVTKTKTVRKWELNTSQEFMNLRAEDFFVGQCINVYKI